MVEKRYSVLFGLDFFLTFENKNFKKDKKILRVFKVDILKSTKLDL